MFAIHRAAATLLVAFGFTDATPNTATLSEAILGDHSSYFERQSGASGVDRLLMWLAERFPEDNDQGALWAAHQSLYGADATVSEVRGQLGEAVERPMLRQRSRRRVAARSPRKPSSTA